VKEVPKGVRVMIVGTENDFMASMRWLLGKDEAKWLLKGQEST